MTSATGPEGPKLGDFRPWPGAERVRILEAMADVRTSALPRHVVQGQRNVTLRRLVPSDVDGLDALYRSLPAHDRYQRFFTEGNPPRRTVERYVALVDGSGFGVVAVTDAGRIVGEAGYGRRDSDGEFGITVAADWRGLGGVLLDTIVDYATEAGVPGLQADVLSDNRAMLSLAARRGYAIIHTPDRTVQRILIGTASEVPDWPVDTPHPRLLVETTASQWRAASEADAAGFSIISCRSPSSFRNGRCPALYGQPCPLVEGADAVVVALPADDGSRSALTSIHHFCHAHIPVFFQKASGEASPPWIPDGMPTLPAQASPPKVVEALTAAVPANPRRTLPGDPP